MIIVDTNVVLELMRDEPDPMVMAWASAKRVDEVVICVVTVTEIERGISRLLAGRRRAVLESRWDQLLDGYRDTIVGYDLAAARAVARILVQAEQRGRPIGLEDAKIAGMCLATGADLATRNVRDFSDVAAIEVVNPFEA